jgi:hypothetical protein
VIEKVWKDEYYLRSYQLAKSGLNDIQIAKALGVTYKTFKRWKVKKRALRNSLADARKKESGFETFQDYVYGRLTQPLQELWDQLTKTKKNNTVEAVEALLKDHGDQTRKSLFLYALVNSNFDPTKACKKVNIQRKKLDKWIDTDPEFCELVNEIHIAKKDFFEGLLVEGARQGDANLIKFANMTLNSDRGYNPKTVIAHEGQVDINHNVMRIDELGLPLKDRIKILEAMRERKQANGVESVTDREEEPDEGDEVIDAEFEVVTKKKGKR